MLLRQIMIATKRVGPMLLMSGPSDVGLTTEHRSVIVEAMRFHGIAQYGVGNIAVARHMMLRLWLYH